MTLRADRVTWSGQGWAAFVAAGLPPSITELSAQNIRLVPGMGDPVMEYLFAERMRYAGFDASLSARWDSATGDYTIDPLHFDFGPMGDITYRLTATGIDLTGLDALFASLRGAGIAFSALDVTSLGLFESLALMAMGPVLLGDSDDPEAELTRIKVLAAGYVLTLPDPAFDTETRAALVALIDTLPHPWGDLTVTMQADPPVTAARVQALAESPDFDPFSDIGAALEGVKFTVAWNGREPGR